MASEIRRWLEHGERGHDAAALMAGKLVEKRGLLLVSPMALIERVRERLVDDVLPRATIAEAAVRHLGMRQSRPRFVGAEERPRAWSFPLPLRGERASQPRLVPLGSTDGPRGMRGMSRTANELRNGSSGSIENDLVNER